MRAISWGRTENIPSRCGKEPRAGWHSSATQMWEQGPGCWSGPARGRLRDCHSPILQLWKFRVVHWAVTNKNPLGLTINQALVSLGLAIVADVTSCKELRLGLALKGGKKQQGKRFFWDLIAWHLLWFWGSADFTAKCILGLGFIVLWL